jgi:sarcosine oxidase/L-pipecolate oxidase
MPQWDAIVVGAGIEGSAAAYTLAKLGQKTLQLEQFILPHSRGSSHGHSRITRMAYAEDYYTQMMVDAFKLWDDLEKESNQKIYVKTGLLAIDSRGSASLDEVESAIKSTPNGAYQRLSGQRLRDRFPTMLFDDSFEAIFDPTGGILCADKCLQAYQRQFVKYGGVLQDGEPVHSVTSDGVVASVKTAKGEYTARSVVIAAGPWTSRLTDPLGLRLPLQPERVSVWYWKQLHPGAFGNDGCPVFIRIDGDNELYGFPAFEYPGYVKVAFHGGPRCHADSRDSVDVDPFYRDTVASFVRRHLFGVEPTPSIIESCIYTVMVSRWLQSSEEFWPTSSPVERIPTT